MPQEQSDTDLLIRRLGADSAARNFAWSDACYRLIPSCRFRIMGSFKGPLDKVALFVQPDPAGEADFGQLAAGLYREDAGMALVHPAWTGALPDILLPYGAVWSFAAHGLLGGNGMLVQNYKDAMALDPDDPFAAIREETDIVEMGQPSEEFFPHYVREKITADLVRAIPGGSVDFVLVDCLRYVMGKRIAVSVQSPQDFDRQEIQELLDWYAPPYLPVILT